MTTDPGKAPVPPGIESSDDVGVREGIADLRDAEVHDLVKLTFFWGMLPAGYYEMRYVYTQLKTHPNCVGVGRMKWDRQPRHASDRSSTTPNATTLYGFGFYDLDTEPVAIITPEILRRRVQRKGSDETNRCT
jgi:hypothetical protein